MHCIFGQSIHCLNAPNAFCLIHEIQNRSSRTVICYALTMVEVVCIGMHTFFWLAQKYCGQMFEPFCLKSVPSVLLLSAKHFEPHAVVNRETGKQMWANETVTGRYSLYHRSYCFISEICTFEDICKSSCSPDCLGLIVLSRDVSNAGNKPHQLSRLAAHTRSLYILLICDEFEVTESW